MTETLSWLLAETRLQAKKNMLLENTKRFARHWWPWYGIAGFDWLVPSAWCSPRRPWPPYCWRQSRPIFPKGSLQVQPVRYYLDQLNVPIGTCSAWLMRPRPIPAWVSFCKGNSNSKVEQKYKYCQYYFGENKWMNERFCPSFSLPLVFLMLTRNEDLTSHRLTNMLLFRLS